MIRQIAAALMVVTFLALFAGALWLDGKNDAETVAKREAAPQAERVGEIAINNTTGYLWTFDFEGRRCLWITLYAGRGGSGGLTCWEETS